MSFENIYCVSPPDARHVGKCIEIWPRCPYPYEIFESEDLRDYCEFVTLPPMDEGGMGMVGHEIPVEMVVESGVRVGERYEVRLSEGGLGCVWWDFISGEVLEGEGVSVERWSRRKDDDGEGVRRGGQPSMLALVDEGGVVGFEVVD